MTFCNFMILFYKKHFNFHRNFSSQPIFSSKPPISEFQIFLIRVIKKRKFKAYLSLKNCCLFDSLSLKKITSQNLGISFKCDSREFCRQLDTSTQSLQGYMYVYCHISRPLPQFTPTGYKDASRPYQYCICLCNYMAKYECMYMYTAVLLPQVYTICIGSTLPPRKKMQRKLKCLETKE